MCDYPIESRTVCLRDFFVKTRESSVIKNSREHYVIPYYQRPYEWEWKDKQLKGLVNAFINLSYEKSDDYTDEKLFSYKQDEYVVFGTIQINENGGYEIIDGQQRIISFWIFIKAIDDMCGTNESPSISFELENQISKKYQGQFDSFRDSKAGDKEGNQYSKNYNDICSELKKIHDVNKLIQLKEYILDRVLFSLMLTSFKDRVEKTISLFDTLNTKGLDLGMKDLFKIKYFEFLKKNMKQSYSVEEAKKIFDKINRAYECCRVDDLSPMFQKDEGTLIDTFKLWIVMRNPEYRNKLPEKVKASSNRFFVDVDEQYSVWKEEMTGEDDVRSLSTFVGISVSILQTQRIMQRINANPLDNFGKLKDPIVLCSDEFLTHCGYWYYRNLFYVFTHAIRSNKQDKEDANLNETDVERALSLCEIIWKICSVLKTKDQKVKNGNFTKIASIIVFVFIENPEIDIEDLCYKDIVDEYISSFREVISGNIFDNRQDWFFNTLLYMKDCDYRSDFCEQRRIIFHAEKKERCEIEHIVSKAFCKESSLAQFENQIGNLIFLNNGINSALGSRTKTIESSNPGLSVEEKLVIDFNGKIQNSKSASYWKENNTNAAISKFLDSIPERCVNGEKSMDIGEIQKLIKERNEERQSALFEIYKDIMR